MVSCWGRGQGLCLHPPPSGAVQVCLGSLGPPSMGLSVSRGLAESRIPGVCSAPGGPAEGGSRYLASPVFTACQKLETQGGKSASFWLVFPPHLNLTSQNSICTHVPLRLWLSVFRAPGCVADNCEMPTVRQALGQALHYSSEQNKCLLNTYCIGLNRAPPHPPSSCPPGVWECDRIWKEDLCRCH